MDRKSSAVANYRYSCLQRNYFYLGQYQEPKLEDPKLWNVIGRSLDIAIAAQEKHAEKNNYDCDLLITKELQVPLWKRALFVRFLHIDNMEDYYRAGRETAGGRPPAPSLPRPPGYAPCDT